MTLQSRVASRLQLVVAFLSALAAASAFSSASANQCAPYAREISGINLFGSAWTWWDSAAGQYSRGHAPAVGAALVFKKRRGMPSGHVAVVTRVVSSREIRVDHANWVHRRGRGSVQHGARVIDVSARNDWSAVRVWYEPVNGFGTNTYDVYGFIYRGGTHYRGAAHRDHRLHVASR